MQRRLFGCCCCCRWRALSGAWAILQLASRGLNCYLIKLYDHYHYYFCYWNCWVLPELLKFLPRTGAEYSLSLSFSSFDSTSTVCVLCECMWLIRAERKEEDLIARTSSCSFSSSSSNASFTCKCEDDDVIGCCCCWWFSGCQGKELWRSFSLSLL